MKNTIILILSLLVIGLGSFLIFDKVINKEESKTIENSSTNANNQITNEPTQTENKCEPEPKIDSKYVGKYIGSKGNDELIINEDGTYSLKRAISSDFGVENRGSSGMVVTNGVYLVLAEMYDEYQEVGSTITYYFIVEGNSLKNLELSKTESPVFNKQ